MERKFAAVVIAAAISGTLSPSFAGPLQITQHASSSQWRCVVEPSSSSGALMRAEFSLDESAFVSLMLHDVLVERDVLDAHTISSSDFAVTSSSMAACWSSDRLDSAMDAFVASMRPSGRHVLAVSQAPKAVPFTAIGDMQLSIAEHELLQWDGSGWAASDALADEQHLPLSLDYSTVSLPTPFVMGAIGLVAIVVVGRRRHVRAA